MDNVESLLQELTNAHGPSGFEGPVRAIMQRELSGRLRWPGNGRDRLAHREAGRGERLAQSYDGCPHGRGRPHGQADNQGRIRDVPNPGRLAGPGPHQPAMGHHDQERPCSRSHRREDHTRDDRRGSGPAVQEGADVHRRGRIQQGGRRGAPGDPGPATP